VKSTEKTAMWTTEGRPIGSSAKRDDWDAFFNRNLKAAREKDKTNAYRISGYSITHAPFRRKSERAG
jgi:hypothetical protein